MENKINVLNFFENNADAGFVICKTCKSKLKSNRVSNLKTHLFKQHNININNKENSESFSVSSSSKMIRKKKIKIEINKKELLRSYIGLITEDSIPFNVLNSPNMRKILDPICEGLRAADGKKLCLNASNAKKTLELVANNIKNDIGIELKNKLLSLKIDSATRLCRNIFGISAQFICDGQIKSRILGMVELKGAASSNSKNLAMEILKVLKNYDINLKQVVSVTSDNGANMLKATKLLSFVSEETEENESDSTNDEYLRKIELVEEMPVVMLGNIQVCRCAAHTAQLCAIDVTKSPTIINFLLTCRNLTKFIRKTSNGYREIFEIKKFKIPQLDCPTRWGSTYTMLANLKAAKDILTKIESVKNKTQDENFEFDDSIWDFIESYCIVFDPLQKAIKIFQEEQLHYSNFYAQWLKCKICTEQILVKSNQAMTQTIGKLIMQSFEKRTPTLLSNCSLVACLYLDPRFQHTLTAKQKVDAIHYLKRTWDRINEINPGGIVCSTPNSISHNNHNQFFDDEDELLHEYLSGGVEANVSNVTDVYIKIEHLQLPFLRCNLNVLEFWKDKRFTDPELYALSNVCFAIPPTQVCYNSILHIALIMY